MRPRLLLILFGIIVTIISTIALIQQNPRFTGFSVLSDKLSEMNLPSSVTIYLLAILIIGIIAIVVGINQRKVIY